MANRMILRLAFFLIIGIPFCGFARAESRVTQIGRPVAFEFSRAGLGADVFPGERTAAMEPRTKTEILESLDDSMLIVFGDPSPEVFDAVFRDRDISAALTRLLNRGGAMFFSDLGYESLRRLPASMKEFFREHKAFLPDPANYRSGTKSGREEVYYAFANPSLSRLPLLSAPNRLTRDDWPQSAESVNWWEGYPSGVMPILIEPEKPHRTAVLLQQSVAGKGRILFSLSYSLDRQARSPFFQNLVKMLYGKTEPSTARQGSRRSAPMPLADAAGKNGVLHAASGKADDFKLDGKLDDPIWKQAKPVHLSNKLSEGGQPAKPTQVWMAVAGDRLVVAFRAKEPNLDGRKADIRRRDGELWTNDSVDVVLNIADPSAPDLRQWIVSASDALFDAKRGNREWTSGAEAVVGREADAWTVELAIPLKDAFDGEAAPKTFFANIGRHEHQVGEISTWILTDSLLNTETFGVVTTLSPDGLRQAMAEEARQAAAADNRTGFLIWSVEPGTQSLGPSTFPGKDQKALERIALQAPGRGHDSAVILVTNFDEEPVTFRINHPRVLTGPDGGSVPFENVFTLCQAVPRLNSYQKIAFDPLVEIGPARIVTVPGGETFMIWLDARALTGKWKYEAKLEFLPITTPLKSITQKQWLATGVKPPPVENGVKVSLDVAAATFPDPIHVNSYTFGPYYHEPYSNGLEAQYVDFTRRFHITYVLDKFPREFSDGPTISNNPADYFNERTKVLSAAGRLFYSYDMLLEFDKAIRRHGFKGETLDDRWKELFQTWIGNWIEALAKHGITTKDFYIQVLEEPGSDRYPLAYKQLAFLKEKFPQVQTAMTVGSGSLQEELNALAPYIDLWIPHENRLTGRDTGPSELAFYRKQGNFWPYLCSTRADVMSLLEYYRYRGIRNWLLGSNGIALFAFNAWRGDPWAQWDVVPDTGGGFYDECLAYNAVNGPVPSQRLMEFRQGIEDFALLEMLRVKRNLPQREALLKQLDGTPLDPRPILQSTNPTDIRQWRSRLLKTLDE